MGTLLLLLGRPFLYNPRVDAFVFLLLTVSSGLPAVLDRRRSGEGGSIRGHLQPRHSEWVPCVCVLLSEVCPISIGRADQLANQKNSATAGHESENMQRAHACVLL